MFALKNSMKKNITFSKAETGFYQHLLREAVFTQLKMLFAAIGATYDSDKKQYSFNSIDDLSEEDMVEIYTRKEAIDNLDIPKALKDCNIRSIVPCNGEVGTRLKKRALQGEDTFAYTPVEVLRFGHTQQLDSATSEQLLPASNLNGTFKGCSNLHTIYPIDVTKVENISDSTFKECYVLRELRLYGLSTGVNIAHSPLISSSSLHYIVSNAVKKDVKNCIKLHPNTYKMLVGLQPDNNESATIEWEAVYETAKKKNITFDTDEFIAYTKGDTLYVNIAAIDDETVLLHNEKTEISGKTIHFDI